MSWVVLVAPALEKAKEVGQCLVAAVGYVAILQCLAPLLACLCAALLARVENYWTRVGGLVATLSCGKRGFTFFRPNRVMQRGTGVVDPRVCGHRFV